MKASASPRKSPRSNSHLHLFSTAAALAILSGPIHAQTHNWTAGGLIDPNLWTNPDNWSLGVLPGEFDTAAFNATTAQQVVSLDGTTQEIATLTFSANTTTQYHITDGTLIFNTVNQTADDPNQLQSTVTVRTKNNGADVLTGNVTSNQLQLQGQITSGGLIKTGGGILRLGTSGTAFNNQINGNVVINGGTLRASAGNISGSNNPLGGSGDVIIGASGVTLSLTHSNLGAAGNAGVYDFVRNVVADNNSFTLHADRAAGSATSGQSQIGTITVGNATITSNAGNGFWNRTAGLLINPGATTTILANQHLLVNRLEGDAATKIVKTGGGDLRILGHADNAANFAGDIDVAAGWLVLDAVGGNQPLGNANTQINITAATPTVSLRAENSFAFEGVNINAGNNNFNFDVRRGITGASTIQTMSGGVVTIGNATMSITGEQGYNSSLSGLRINPGATAIVNVNVNLGGAAQTLRLNSIEGDAETTLQKNGGQALFLSAVDNPNFLGRLNLNGGTTVIEGATVIGPGGLEVLNPLANAGPLTFLSGSTASFRSETDLDFGTDIAFAPGVLSSTVTIDRIGGGAGVGRTITLGNLNISGGTLTLNNVAANSYVGAADAIQIDAGATGTLNVSTNYAAGQLIGGAGSVFNKTGGSTLTVFSNSSATSSAAINLRNGAINANVAGSLGSGPVTIGGVQNTAGFFTDRPRLNWNASGATTNATGPDYTVLWGGLLDLNATPTASDTVLLRAGGRVQGNTVQLQGLTIGDNLTVEPDAVIVHEQPGAFTGSVGGLENTASLYYGIAATASSIPIIGAGTPWKGLSGDDAVRTFNGSGAGVPAVLNVTGGDSSAATIEFAVQSMYDQQLHLGTTSTSDGTFQFASVSPDGTPSDQKITMAVRGVGGTTLGLVPGGRVFFNETAAVSEIANVVDKIYVQSGTLILAVGQTLGGVPVEVQNGASLDIFAAQANYIDAPLTVTSGGVLFINDNVELAGTGSITIEQGGKLDMIGGPATLLTSSPTSQFIQFTGSNHTVRFNRNNVAELDARVPDQGVTYVVGGDGTAATVPSTNVSVITNTQSAGLTLENGILTNDGSSRAFSGPLRLNDTDFTVAATRGTTFIVTSPVSTTANVQIGSLTPIDNRDKSLNSGNLNSLGAPDPFNSETRVIFTDAFSAKDVDVQRTHLAFTNANTTIGGTLTIDGGVVYLDSGGPVAGTAATLGELTPKLLAGDLASKIILGTNSRVEIGLTDPAAGTRHELNQPFVISGDVNPQDKRSFWVNRTSTAGTVGVNFNDITLLEGGVFHAQESSTDVRASLKVAGNSTIMNGAGNTNWDLINVTRDASLPAFDGTNPVIVTQGRVNTLGTQGENNLNSLVFGEIGAGVQIDLVRGQLFFTPSSTINGVIRAQTAAVGGDAFVVSTSNSTSNTFNTETTIGGAGRIEIGRSGAANGSEDFEIRGTEVTNATASQAPLHTHAGEIRIVNDGNAGTIDGIIRSNRANDSDRVARVRVDNVVLTSDATVQLASLNGIPLTLGSITLQGNGTVNTAAANMTIENIAAGTSILNLTGSAAPTINAVTASRVNVTDGSANFTGNVPARLAITRGGASFNLGGAFAEAGPVDLDLGSLRVANGSLDLGNNFVTSASSEASLVAGLREGLVSGSFNETAPNTSNVVKFGPVMAQTTAGWPDNSTFIYTGEFFVPNNNGDGTGTFAFAENFDDSVRVNFDGMQILRNTVWNDATGTGAITRDSGWYPIELRFGQGAGGAGPNTSDGWTTALGFGIDLTNPIEDVTGVGIGTSPAMSQFVAPLDNGSMNLFRTMVSSDVNVAANSSLRAAGITNLGAMVFGGSNSRIELTGSAASSARELVVSSGGSGTLMTDHDDGIVSVVNTVLSGSLTKAGPGELRISGTGAGAGAVSLEGGSLTFLPGGSIAGSVSMMPETVLGGTGTVGGSLDAFGGIVSPGGAGPGLLTVGGGFSLESAATLRIELQGGVPGSGYDQVLLPDTSFGNVIINDATLQATATHPPFFGQAFVIVQNSGLGSLFGTFSNVPADGSAFLISGQQFRIDYAFDADGDSRFNDIALIAVPEPGSLGMLLASAGLMAGLRRFRRRS